MKKTFFMRTFNLNINLIILASLAGLLGWTLNFLPTHLNLNLPISLNLSPITIYLKLGSHYSYWGMTILLTILAITLIHEIMKRVRFDSLVNYGKSIYHTLKLRNFLAQREKSEKITTIESQTIITYNPINGSFNRCTHKSVVDIQKEEIIVFIKVPKDQQGQKVLNDITSQLKKEVSSQHPDFYFSSPNRVCNNLWLVGKK